MNVKSTTKEVVISAICTLSIELLSKEEIKYFHHMISSIRATLNHNINGGMNYDYLYPEFRMTEQILEQLPKV